jgi:hypothetical protein
MEDLRPFFKILANALVVTCFIRLTFMVMVVSKMMVVMFAGCLCHFDSLRTHVRDSLMTRPLMSQSQVLLLARYF